jgi:DNA-binding NtrC family response regulator
MQTMSEPDRPIHVLFVDDDASLREITTMQLEDAGLRVTACSGGAAAIAAFEAGSADVVLTDLKMPDVDGMQVLRAVHRLDSDMPVLVLTAFGSVDTAVAAMQAGAHDYITKPVARDTLLLKVQRAAEHRRVLRENRSLRSRVEAAGERPMLVVSSAMERLMDQVRRVASADLPLLLTGESGTGKELIAREVHRASERADRAFVAVNCAAIPGELLEAELFGHTRGAFTGASKARDGRFRAAEGGTLLLDEIGDLPIELQPKLLRVLQERHVQPVGADRPVPVDVRIIAASHRDLAALVREGKFREDLFYRLAVLPLQVPPLRQRRAAIVPLFKLFLNAQARLAGRTLELSPSSAEELRQRAWPGNVRQLENVARRVALLAPGPTVELDDLPAPQEGSTVEAGQLGNGSVLRVRFDADPWEITFPRGGMQLPELEAAFVREAIRVHGGNKSAASRYLGIPRHVLLYRLEKYGIEPADLLP